MNKKIMFVIAVVMCISLCACEKASQKSEIAAIQMQINSNEALLCLSDANKEIIKSLYEMQEGDAKKSTEHYQEALKLIKDAKERIDVTISSPNFISKELEWLEENYEETILMLPTFLELSQEETDRVVELMNAGSNIHIRLIKALHSFAFLYEIREFDQLPDSEAQANLKESWWMFGFSDDIECPETIEKQELYLIWARQYFDKFDEEMFLTELESIRENDDLSSTECNQRWTELIENFILQREESAPSSGRSLSVKSQNKFENIFKEQKNQPDFIF